VSGTILHADADAFFASVEQRDAPRLRGRPVIVGGGVVMAASYEARAFGVHGGMSGPRARRLCPDAVVVEPRFDAYIAASRAPFAVFERTAPLVEGVSMEDAFLDVRGLERIAGPPVAIAARLRRDVRAEVGLAVTVGVASTKVAAKVASCSAKPDGLLVLPAGGELEFLHPLPLERLWGVGAATAAKLRGRGLTTIGDVARVGENALVELLGKAAGRHIGAIARNEDRQPVRARGRRRSFGSQFAAELHGPGETDAALVAVVERVARRMRASGRIGRTVVLRLRFGDFSTRVSRSRTLPEATAATATILAAARSLLAAAAPLIEREGLTLVGVSVSNLEHAADQLALPFAGASVDATVDDVRDRFGSAAITRAALLGGEERLAPWLQPGDEPGELRH
jgi:DNA polymerase IV